MTFLTKAKEILSPKDFQLINSEDLEASYKGIQKRIRAYRDELQYSKDKEFIEAKRKRIERLRVIGEDLRMLIDKFKSNPKEMKA